jgi:hypothetical protein
LGGTTPNLAENNQIGLIPHERLKGGELMSIADVNSLWDDDRDFLSHTCPILVLVEHADGVAV